VSSDLYALAVGVAVGAALLRLVWIALGMLRQLQQEFLVRHGCDELQGYRFGRPVVAREIAAVLRGR